ncbi:hypothetical protein SeMB42_g02021 [Synchytrium endobioticum]|uniref:Transcription elongation factor Spt6 n=1 Tax=Synchytrium endobioticum TaxID=286115 RepID=A0A507D9A6_9FUNG|nr:hypothetical protein SeLEV6574_g02298 [Synchytrium endobioticum]TPX51141.1 hypothetical protein SeMB42_g02021 [Synchytrium endobioticum]
MAEENEALVQLDDDEERPSDRITDNEPASAQPSKKRKKVGENEDDESGDETLKPSTSKPGMYSDDEEDEEEEAEQEGDDELGNFIADDDEEIVDEEDDESSSRRKRKKRRKSRVIEELDEEDMDLVRENMGGGGEFKRLRRMVDEREGEADDDDDMNRMFAEDETGQGDGAEAGLQQSRLFDDLDEDEEDDFIVNDEEGEDGAAIRPRPRVMKKSRSMPAGIDSEKYDDLMDIFGDGMDYDYALQPEVPEADRDREEEGYAEREDRPKKDSKKLTSVFEPAALSRLMLTDRDEQIESTDLPERFQLLEEKINAGPWAAESRAEIIEESEWIARKLYAFRPERTVGSADSNRLDANLVDAVQYTVKWLRDKDEGGYEVPHIAQYAKDYINKAWTLEDGGRDSLRISDLWRIFDLDAEYRVYSNRRRKLKELIEAVRHGLPDGEILLIDNHFDQAQTNEALTDLHRRITALYPDVVQEAVGTDTSRHAKLIQMTRWKQNGIIEFSENYGIDASQIVNEFRFGFKVHIPQDPRQYPEEIAQEYVSTTFEQSNNVLHETENYLVLKLSTDPGFRSWIRSFMESKAVVSFKPSPKGRDVIDVDHPFRFFKYLYRKPLIDLAQLNKAKDPLERKDNREEREEDAILQMYAAEQQGLGQILIDFEENNFGRRLESIFCNESYGDIATKWNERRRIVARRVYHDCILPDLIHHVRTNVLKDAQDALASKLEEIFSRRAGRAGYMPRREDDELDQTYADDLPRVLSLTLIGPPFSPSIRGAVIDEEGRLKEHWVISNVIERQEDARNDPRENFLKQNSGPRREIIKKLNTIRPEYVAIAGFHPNIRTLHDILKGIIDRDGDIALRHRPPCDMVEDDVARLFRNSHRARTELPLLDEDVRYLVALGRKVQDPTMEYAALMNDEMEWKALRLHRNQQYLPDDRFKDTLERALINAVNIYGSDINDGLLHPHRSYTLQYVVGLGPRKARKLMERIRSKNRLLYNREELVTFQYLGDVAKTVFNNCSGSIRVRRKHWEDRNDAPEGTILDILDDTRIHPRHYSYARKMAAYAYEAEAQNDEENPSAIVEELMDLMKQEKNTAALDDLMLEDTEEFQNILGVIIDIREELKDSWREKRAPYRPADAREIFNMLTGEIIGTTIYVDQYLEGSVYRANDRQVRVRINGGELTGSFSAFDIQSRQMNQAQDQKPPFSINQLVNVVVRRIDMIAIFLGLDYVSDEMMRSYRQGDLTRPRNHWNHRQENDDTEEAARANVVKKRKYIPRSIKHADFQNVDSTEAQNYLTPRLRGSFVFRPSSKGPKCLVLTWKVDEGVYQHIEIEESDKEATNMMALGRILKIKDKKYTELDEIIATYLNPLIHMTSEILDSKKFQTATFAEAESFLEKECLSMNKSSYCLIHAEGRPGNFYLVYKHVNTRVKRDGVLVTPSHFEFRGQCLDPPIARLFDAWKKDETKKVQDAQRQLEQQKQQNSRPTQPSGGSATAATGLNAAYGRNNNVPPRFATGANQPPVPAWQPPPPVPPYVPPLVAATGGPSRPPWENSSQPWHNQRYDNSNQSNGYNGPSGGYGGQYARNTGYDHPPSNPYNQPPPPAHHGYDSNNVPPRFATGANQLPVPAWQPPPPAPPYAPALVASTGGPPRPPWDNGSQPWHNQQYDNSGQSNGYNGPSGGYGAQYARNAGYDQPPSGQYNQPPPPAYHG